MTRHIIEIRASEKEGKGVSDRMNDRKQISEGSEGLELCFLQIIYQCMRESMIPVEENSRALYLLLKNESSE